MNVEFHPFPKMERLSREIIVTEKIDGTDAQVFVGDDGVILAGSRSRWITPNDDNFGFAAWVQARRDFRSFESMIRAGADVDDDEPTVQQESGHYGAP